jgi:hypothetical protein
MLGFGPVGDGPLGDFSPFSEESSSGSRTFIRQAVQIRNSFAYTDALAAGSALQISAANIEDDLNALRSQFKRIFWADQAGNWYDSVPTVNSKQRAIKDLNTDLNDLEEQKALARVVVLGDLTVGAGKNHHVLVAANSQTPSIAAAINLTTDGAVVAQSASSGLGFAANELTEISGANAIDPKNLCIIRDASTGQPIQSGGRDVFGLLQIESTGTDGQNFDDASNQVKISFVRMTSGLDDLEACPIDDIEGKVFNYSYTRRIKFDDLPDDFWLNSAAFTDRVATVNITRQQTYDSNPNVELATNADLDLGVGTSWSIRDADNNEILNIDQTGTINIEGDLLDINSAVMDVATGITINSDGTKPITIGLSDGVVATTSGDLRLLAAGEMFFDDGNQAGSSWAQTSGIKLSDTAAEWNSFETTFGEVSLLNAIVAAKNASTVFKAFAMVVTTVSADSNVGGINGGTNLDAQLPDLSGANFSEDLQLYLNGDLLRPGEDSNTENDYYPGSSLANGQIKFKFDLQAGDVICIINQNA